jgi:hypothetical protein
VRGELSRPAEPDTALLPRFLPSPVLARISSRSNSAKPPSTVSIRRPCGLVVSAQVSFNERKPAPRLDTASMTFRRSRDERASRSRSHHHQHVTGLQAAYYLSQLSPVRLSARDLLPVDLGAPGRGQLGHLAG